jgi:hypothetical protein
MVAARSTLFSAVRFTDFISHPCHPSDESLGYFHLSQPLYAEFTAGSGVKPPQAKAVTGHRTPTEARFTLHQYPEQSCLASGYDL